MSALHVIPKCESQLIFEIIGNVFSFIDGRSKMVELPQTYFTF